MGKTNLSPRDFELLSAYLDRELSPKDMARLEGRLWNDPALRNALDELDRTRLMLRSLPQPRTPRNFTLSPTYARMKPSPRLYPVFGVASALAAVFLIFVLLGDLLGMGFPTSTAALPVSSPTTEAVLAAEAPFVTVADTQHPDSAALQVIDTPTGEPSLKLRPTDLPATETLTSITINETVPAQPTVTPEDVAATEIVPPTGTERETVDQASTETPTPTLTPSETPTLSPTEIITAEPSLTISPTNTPLPTNTAIIPTDTEIPIVTPVPAIAMAVEATQTPITVAPIEIVPPRPRVIGDQPVWLGLEIGLALVVLIAAIAAVWNYLRRLN